MNIEKHVSLWKISNPFIGDSSPHIFQFPTIFTVKEMVIQYEDKTGYRSIHWQQKKDCSTKWRISLWLWFWWRNSGKAHKRCHSRQMPCGCWFFLLLTDWPQTGSVLSAVFATRSILDPPHQQSWPSQCLYGCFTPHHNVPDCRHHISSTHFQVPVMDALEPTLSVLSLPWSPACSRQ